MTTLADLADIIRSKNAGPFWLTIDVFFADLASFERALASDLVSAAFIADIYGADSGEVKIFVLRDLLAVKVSLPRPRVQGSFDDRDMHAGQQFVPLLEIDVA